MTHEPIRSGLDLVGRHEREFPTGRLGKVCHWAEQQTAEWPQWKRDFLPTAYSAEARALRRLEGEGA
jgi:hypothetical protein